jgi:hypothetical protein
LIFFTFSDRIHQNSLSLGQGMGALPQFFITGGAARADFLDYLTKGAIIHWEQIRFETGTQV